MCVWSYTVIISHYLDKCSFVMSGGRTYYQRCLFCVVAWLVRCNMRLIMSGLIFWCNNCVMGCDSDVVVCCGYMVLVW